MLIRLVIELLCLINVEGLIKSLGEERVKINEPLSSHTTLRIGGPADYFYEATNSGELIKAVRLARTFGVPVTVIGSGSNILVSDLGIRGLVVRNKDGKIEIVDKKRNPKFLGKLLNQIRDGIYSEARWIGSHKGTMKYDFDDLNYDESKYPDVEVIIDSGVNLQMAMVQLLERGITGLQWYARIPGTLGGAVFNNIHGGSHVFSEIVSAVVVLTNQGDVVKIPAKSMKFEYDKSRIHRTGEIVLEVILNLKRGDAEKAKFVADEWRKRKSIQPVNSAGCTFKNISNEDREVLGYPTTSVGYVIEHVLNMTGYKVGGAAISVDHHNFIINKGKATAKDYFALRNEIVKRARETVGVELADEIVYLGDFNY